MVPCEAMERKGAGLWEGCPQPAAKVLVVNGQPKAYCQAHLDRFMQVLPKKSFTVEEL